MHGVKLLLKLFFVTILPTVSFANFIDTKWTVTDYFGELWFAEEQDIIGKQQEFYKGWAEGAFYSCDYAGQSKTYNTYKLDDFLANKEFDLFKNENVFSKVFSVDDKINGDTFFFVHRITCNGLKVSDRNVMYPFVTVDGTNKGFYIYEGAIIILQYNE